jgi:hypothetical protein
MWYKKIDLKKYLNGDLLEIYDIVGDDLFMKLMERFGKTSVYFSEKPIMDAKIEYIKKHYGERTEKEMARELKVSERLIYKIGSSKYIPSDTFKLFEDKNGE